MKGNFNIAKSILNGMQLKEIEFESNLAESQKSTTYLKVKMF